MATEGWHVFVECPAFHKAYLQARHQPCTLPETGVLGGNIDASRSLAGNQASIA